VLNRRVFWETFLVQHVKRLTISKSLLVHIWIMVAAAIVYCFIITGILSRLAKVGSQKTLSISRLHMIRTIWEAIVVASCYDNSIRLKWIGFELLRSIFNLRLHLRSQFELLKWNSLNQWWSKQYHRIVAYWVGSKVIDRFLIIHRSCRLNLDNLAINFLKQHLLNINRLVAYISVLSNYLMQIYWHNVPILICDC
jgi:hypothetical protein